jgi:hypothetical protein
MARSAESRKLLRQLNRELAATAERTSRELVWSAQELAVLELICDQIDRKVELYGLYRDAEDAAAKTKLSAEVRLLENSISRLLKGVSTDVPTVPRYESQASRRAQHAALQRWAGDRGGAG